MHPNMIQLLVYWPTFQPTEPDWPGLRLTSLLTLPPEDHSLKSTTKGTTFIPFPNVTVKPGGREWF